MDISKLFETKTQHLDLIHPATKKPFGLSVELCSMQDDRVKLVQRAHMDEALSEGVTVPTALKIEENTLDTLVATIVSWKWADGLELGDLKNPPLNPKNVKSLLAIRSLRNQIDKALGNEPAFYHAPKKPSA